MYFVNTKKKILCVYRKYKNLPWPAPEEEENMDAKAKGTL